MPRPNKKTPLTKMKINFVSGVCYMKLPLTAQSAVRNGSRAKPLRRVSGGGAS